MSSRIFHAGAVAALLLAGPARADDAARTQAQDRRQDEAHEAAQAQAREHDAARMQDPPRDAARAAMHEAMQQQLSGPHAGARMPGLPDQAAPAATAALERAAQMQQARDAARQRATARGAQDAATARGDGPARGGMQGGAMHPGAGGMMGDSNTAQQGSGMMRTGSMHGGPGGMMPGGGMMDGSGGTGTGGTGTMGGKGTGTTSTGTSGAGSMMK